MPDSLKTPAIWFAYPVFQIVCTNHLNRLYLFLWRHQFDLMCLLLASFTIVDYLIDYLDSAIVVSSIYLNTILFYVTVPWLGIVFLNYYLICPPQIIGARRHFCWSRKCFGPRSWLTGRWFRGRETGFWGAFGGRRGYDPFRLFWRSLFGCIRQFSCYFDRVSHTSSQDHLAFSQHSI